MPSPLIDIIVPVWNNPFETRACLAAVLAHSPGARLVVVDNGSSRETERMLEEFSDPLGDDGLFVKSERNIGLIPAINMGLELSDSDCAVIVRPHVLVSAGWLAPLVEAAKDGLATPVIAKVGTRVRLASARTAACPETCDISFAALALSRRLRSEIGSFDEQLDGGEWCLRDYVGQAWSHGFRTRLCMDSLITAGEETVFGSEERLGSLARAGREVCHQRWGESRSYAVYFGAKTDAAGLEPIVQQLLESARKGHRFTLFLHRKQQQHFMRAGWDMLHTSLEIRTLSRFTATRDFVRQYQALACEVPAIIPLTGADGALFPEGVVAQSISEVSL
ncbi:MAG TPA: glycosyltransferase [Deltaproteobacteria bacterium]|nr:glycosyltransferase [Deltaproteobacteria bacterium]